MSTIVPPFGKTTNLTLAANDKIAVYSTGVAAVKQLVGYPNEPAKLLTLATINNGSYTSSAFTSGATIVVEAGGAPAMYEIGTAAVVQATRQAQIQPTPNALNATGTLTAAMILGGIVTSTTAAAVSATLDTGAIVEASSDFAVDDSIDWHVINTGGTNAFTIIASTGHTIVGAAAVAANTSGQFRTRKTAANTFVTYRL